MQRLCCILSHLLPERSWLSHVLGKACPQRMQPSCTALQLFAVPDTMIHSGTLCIQWKVMKFPCFGGLVFRAQFQDFLSAFWRSFVAMQLAFVSMITITPTLSLSVFSLQRTRLFLTYGELWRTCGELWLYFEMQWRLDLWSFSITSWSSRRSREAPK